MRTKLFFLSTLFLFASSRSVAQTTEDESSSKSTMQSQPANMVKLNLTSLPLKQYALQYERVLNRKFSVALGVRIMPATTLPFKQAILDAVGDDPDTRNVLETFQLSNTAFTP